MTEDRQFFLSTLPAGRRERQLALAFVLVRLEDSLPVDFGCVALYGAVANTLRVTCVGAKSEALALVCQSTMTEPSA